jgi:hypothetical protein
MNINDPVWVFIALAAVLVFALGYRLGEQVSHAHLRRQVIKRTERMISTKIRERA